MNVQDLPFNKMLGLRTEGPRVLLLPEEKHLNHVGTVHATVICGVAEAAAGHLLSQQFSWLGDSHVAVLRVSSTKYRRPADKDFELSAEGFLDVADASAFEKMLSERNRATVEVTVSVKQERSEILAGTYKWFAAKT